MPIPALMQMVQVLFSFLVFSSWPRERVDRSYPSEVHRLSAMDRVKFHLKFRRNFGLESRPSGYSKEGCIAS
jgi:hypothetical protein